MASRFDSGILYMKRLISGNILFDFYGDFCVVRSFIVVGNEPFIFYLSVYLFF